MHHKILFIPQWYPSENNQFSGTFNRELVLAASIFDEVAVLSFKSRTEHKPTLLVDRVIDKGIPTWHATFGRSPLPKTSWLSFWIYLRRAINMVVKEWGKPDIIHTQDNYTFPVIMCSRHLKIPYVMSQHWSGLTMRPIKKKQLIKYRWVFKKVSCVLSANKFAEVDYQRLGLNARVHWLPNAIDTELFYYGEGTREKWLLHASGLSAPKRFPDVLRAFTIVNKRYPDAVLHVAGDGEQLNSMKAMAKKLLPQASYVFHGFVPKTDLANLMRRCSGFVFPSEYETFGCVLIESMACGLPVLTTQVGGIPAIVGEDQGLFVEVGDIKAIATGMQKLIDGTHGIDIKRVSEYTCSRFNRHAVGCIMHDQYKKVILDSYH